MAYSRLRRNSAQRKALLRDLVTDIIINERIVTTEAKAKELKKAIKARLIREERNLLFNAGVKK